MKKFFLVLAILISTIYQLAQAQDWNEISGIQQYGNKQLYRYLKGMAVFNDSLYICGKFGLLSGNSTPVVYDNIMAKWAGDNLLSVNHGVGYTYNRDAYATALYVEDSLLFVSGFDFTAQPPYNFLFRYNGLHFDSIPFSSLLPVQGKDRIWISSIIRFKEWLVICGEFNLLNGTDTCKNIARWNGSEWQTFGRGLNKFTASMINFKDKLFIGGSFTQVDTFDYKYLVSWDGQLFYQEKNSDKAVYQMEVFQNKLFFSTYSFFVSSNFYMDPATYSYDGNQLTEHPEIFPGVKKNYQDQLLFITSSKPCSYDTTFENQLGYYDGFQYVSIGRNLYPTRSCYTIDHIAFYKDLLVIGTNGIPVGLNPNANINLFYTSLPNLITSINENPSNPGKNVVFNSLNSHGQENYYMQTLNCSVYDLSGKLVYRKQFKPGELDVLRLGSYLKGIAGAGMYIYTLSSKNVLVKRDKVWVGW